MALIIILLSLVGARVSNAPTREMDARDDTSAVWFYLVALQGLSEGLEKKKKKKNFSLHFYLPISSFLCRERERKNVINKSIDRAPPPLEHTKTHSRVCIIVPTRSFSSYSDGSWKRNRPAWQTREEEEEAFIPIFFNRRERNTFIYKI